MNYKEYNFFSEEFEDQLTTQIKKVENNYGDLSITMTGNAFVDAGIYAVSVIQDKELTEITVNDVLQTILNIDGQQSNGKAFARRNARIKTTSKVLLNNPLNQNAYGGTTKSKTGYYKAPSKAEPSPLQERLYRAYLIEFLLSYGEDQEIEDKNSQCVICGYYTDLDFNDLETTLKILGKNESVDKKDEFGSGPTRLWFPLLGSTSSIQSFPGFAEPNILCGKCLTLSQFLPQIADLQNGLLTLYQSSNQNFAREFYRSNLATFEQRHQNTPRDKKLEIIGKDNWDYYINNLLRIIRENKANLDHANLILWKFDNFGTDPDLDYIQLPNQTLRFLYELIVTYDAESMIKDFIRFEDENKLPYRLRFFNCIEARNDYILFYPHTKYDVERIIPQEIYELYQIYIRRWSQRNLLTVRKISQQVKQDDDAEDELLRVLKSRNTGELGRFLTPHLLTSLQNNIINTDDLLFLFEYSDEEVTNLNPWKLFQYYLHPNLVITTDTLQESEDQIRIDETRTESLAIIQTIANDTLELRKSRSAFDLDRYIDRLSTYRFSNFRDDYVRVGFSNPNLTWQRIELIQHHLYRYEILFYFRIFSIEPTELLKLPDYQVTVSDLIDQSGLHPVLANVIIEYINKREEEIGESRVFSELDEDLKYGRYSSRQFFNILLKKMNDNKIETVFDEYHYFTYELEYSSNYETKSGSKRRPSFSWRRLQNKLRLFIRQYRQVRTPTLEQQLKEEQI